jgi:outer membrane receptor protein involved in Fe transport
MLAIRSMVALAATVFALPVLAEEAALLSPVQITATRLPQSVDVVPVTVSIVRGEELRARGANDLRTALSLVAGVEIAPGGDAGPAGSVPAFYGFREFDAFLLVVDGVPAGGAFNPTLSTLDLHNIKQIEVMRGAAPVMYGATSFVGVIHVIHYPAGESEQRVRAAIGMPGSGELSGATVLSSGPYKQSLAVDARRDSFGEDRTAVNRAHVAYRLATTVGEGTARADVDLLQQHQVPAGVTRRRGIGGVQRLWPETSPDDNQNPSDAHINEGRRQITLGYDLMETPLGTFGTTLAITQTDTSYIRGFMAGNGLAAPDNALPAGNDADGFNQSRNVLDVYYDAHFSRVFGPVTLTYGLDWLHGDADVRTGNFAYRVSRNGTVAESSTEGDQDEFFLVKDRRNFLGAYLQGGWKITPDVEAQAGLRLNHTRERLQVVADARGTPEAGEDSLSKTRVSGTVGLSWTALRQGVDHVVLYADYRNSFKPLAFEFAPEMEPDEEILPAETARTYEAGFKGAWFGGRLSYDVSGFYVNFDNAKHYTAAGEETGGGRLRFAGGEAETRFTLMKDLDLAAHYAYHEQRFVFARTDDGTDVSGNRPEMSPHVTYGVGLLYLPANGFNAAIIDNFTGGRFLNKKNTGPLHSYSTLDAHLGYHFAGGVDVALDASNLGDARDAVSESEYSEELNGAAYTRLQGRRVFLSIAKAI